MNCFQRVGINRTDTLTDEQLAAGGKLCVCGERVRFDLPKRRAAHFVVCPVVDKRVNEGIEGIEVDPVAVEVGVRFFGGVDA